jgi:pimeloyl-ACP methyl ester carboxylesterase
MKRMFQRSIAVAVSLSITALTMGYALGARCVVVPADETADVAASTGTTGEPGASRLNNVKQSASGKYADVNGLKMYYEVHGSGGSGHPLVLLHGAFGFAGGWATILPALTKGRRVIAVELEGHGRTRDLDRPLTYQQMVEDTAALLRQLKIKDADVFGYSMGGVVALGVAIRHPELVRKLAILGSGSNPIKEIFEPETYKQFQSITDDFAPPVFKEPYNRLAPDPTRWPVLVKKIKNMVNDYSGYPPAEVKTIRAKTLIMQGDRDGIRPEHAVELFRLIPNSQLAIFPGGDHFVLFSNPDLVISTLVPFLDAPLADQKRSY